MPAYAHEVKVSGDIGGTLHIAPQDHPHAGKPAQAQIALIRKGGEILPLAQCNCKLAVYPEPHTEGSSPLLEPPLKAISAEQYQGIPGAEIVFPKGGEYELELNGTPKAGANFKPFQLGFPVTVAAGTAASTASPQKAPQTGYSPSSSAEANQAAQQPTQKPAAQWPMTSVIGLAVIVGLGILWAVRRRLK